MNETPLIEAHVPRNFYYDANGCLSNDLRRICMTQRLKAELHAQLNLARAGGEVRANVFGRGVPKDVRVGQEGVRLVELHAVEQVIELEAQVEFDALANSHLLVQDGIGVVDAWATKVIAAEIAARVEGRNGKKRGGGPGLRARVAAWRHGGARSEIRP